MKINAQQNIGELQKFQQILHRGYVTPPSQWTYDIEKSYDWNYEFGPFFKGHTPERHIKAEKQFLSYKVNSLFGVPAGPLLNSKWIELYSKLGFDILTYKTFRSRTYAAHPRPHMLYVEPSDMEKTFIGKPYTKTHDAVTMTNSFGIPSKDPDVWQMDFKRALKVIQPGQVVIASIVGTLEGTNNEDEYINDFVQTALLAMKAGAYIIEVNLSCPNLHNVGLLCFDLSLSTRICSAIKNAIGNIPLLVKISHFDNMETTRNFVKNTHEYVAGYSVINTVQGKVDDIQVKREVMRKIGVSGLCGSYIRPYGLMMVERLKKIREEMNLDYAIVGMGGVTTPEDYELYLQTGADAVQAGIGAMMDPYLAHKIYEKQAVHASNYHQIKSLGMPTHHIPHHYDLKQLKKMYLDMIYSPIGPEVRNVLFIDEKPFELKHGETNGKQSHIYINHRIVLMHDWWDRKLLAQIFDTLIREKLLPVGEDSYTMLAVPSYSSPELTACVLENFGERVNRIVQISQETIQKEKGDYRNFENVDDLQKPLIVVDDVFTSGRTVKEALDEYAKQHSNRQIDVAVLVTRDPKTVEAFNNLPNRHITSLVTLDEILKYHWKQFTPLQKKLIKAERLQLR
ncbi:hypothetical protein HGB07_04925 [Candidatus Roizmanbacteria bacterium]|nr:hypothetical protein [Candidatus Roizmanbacteria bacterium]